MKIFMKLAMLMIFMAAQISFAVLTDIKDESREIISLRRARQIENFDTIGSTWTKYDERAYSVYSSLTISNDPGESEKLKGQLIALLPFVANSSLRYQALCQIGRLSQGAEDELWALADLSLMSTVFLNLRFEESIGSPRSLKTEEEKLLLLKKICFLIDHPNKMIGQKATFIVRDNLHILNTEYQERLKEEFPIVFSNTP